MKQDMTLYQCKGCKQIIAKPSYQNAPVCPNCNLEGTYVVSFKAIL